MRTHYSIAGQILTRRLMTNAGGHAYKRMLHLLQMPKYPGRLEDVAQRVLFLTSDRARFITAEIIDIDGGCLGKV